MLEPVAISTPQAVDVPVENQGAPEVIPVTVVVVEGETPSVTPDGVRAPAESQTLVQNFQYMTWLNDSVCSHMYQNRRNSD